MAQASSAPNLGNLEDAAWKAAQGTVQADRPVNLDTATKAAYGTLASAAADKGLSPDVMNGFGLRTTEYTARLITHAVPDPAAQMASFLALPQQAANKQLPRPGTAHVEGLKGRLSVDDILAAPAGSGRMGTRPFAGRGVADLAGLGIASVANNDNRPATRLAVGVFKMLDFPTPLNDNAEGVRPQPLRPAPVEPVAEHGVKQITASPTRHPRAAAQAPVLGLMAGPGFNQE